jgi:hypothetical protein
MRLLPHRAIGQDHKTLFVSPHHDNVKSSYCDHKIDLQREPRINCEQCWAFYFIQNREFTTEISQRYVAGQKTQLVNQFGSKLVKKLETFMVTIAKAREIQKQLDKELIADTDRDVTISANGIGGF